MRGARTRHVIAVTGVRAIVLAAAAAFLLACPLPTAASAAPSGPENSASPLQGPPIAGGEKMLVESDELVYDYDRETVSAVGNVKIYYGGYTLEANKVTYNQRSGRLIATGAVTMVDPNGLSYYTEYVDITDDFRDGFVESLRVDNPVDRTHFAAARAIRTDGSVTTFEHGVYTACEPCKEHPERPPLWNVRAAKIVADQKEHMIYFTDARFEFFGMPIAWLPYLAVPDPSVKRKSGFLTPNFGYASRVGSYLSTPYFLALAPNYDVTITPTFYTQQGVLTDVEWRHRLENGTYSIRAAGIYQFNPQTFAGTAGNTNLRGGIRTTGAFNINQDWTLGWDGTLSSDPAFTRQYSVLNLSQSESAPTIYLTGLKGTNYFNAQTTYYQILTNTQAGPQYSQNRQAWVAPVIDYHRIADSRVVGGELSFTTNVANVVRAADDPFLIAGNPVPYYHGTAGTTTRATQEVAWQRRMIGPMGAVFTPFASARGDAFYLTNNSAATTLAASPTAFRFMPTIGAEVSLPVLMTVGGASHIIEPIGQIIARTNETGAGTIPNNDAESLVFDVSNLFERDKFSGYDRIEGGTRANVGIRYHGRFASGASIEGTFGQSIQLAGVNPFAGDPLSNVGAYSGLETQRSDYVGGLTINSGVGPRLEARARFDDATFQINRGELQATAALGPITATAGYLYIRSNPNLGQNQASSVVRAAASANFAENWRAFGTMTYDVANRAIAGNSFGIAYDDECLTFSVAYSETRLNYTDLHPNRWLNFRLQLRTLTEGAITTDISGKPRI